MSEREFKITFTETIVSTRTAPLSEIEFITGLRLDDFDGDMNAYIESARDANTEIWEWLERYADVTDNVFTVEELTT